MNRMIYDFCFSAIKLIPLLDVIFVFEFVYLLEFDETYIFFVVGFGLSAIKLIP